MLADKYEKSKEGYAALAQEIKARIIEYIANPFELRSIDEFTKDAEFSRETYYKHLRENRTEIYKEADKLRKKYLGELREKAWKALARRMQRSDKTLQMVLEMTGDYIPKSEQKVEYTTPEQKRERLGHLLDKIQKDAIKKLDDSNGAAQ